jgi:hypothetical protein
MVPSNERKLEGKGKYTAITIVPHPYLTYYIKPLFYRIMTYYTY